MHWTIREDDPHLHIGREGPEQGNGPKDGDAGRGHRDAGEGKGYWRLPPIDEPPFTDAGSDSVVVGVVGQPEAPFT